MNESMNFGNIGFGNVSSGNNSAPQETIQTPATEVPTTPQVKSEPAKVDLMAGVKEAKEEEERKRLEEEQAIQDFKKAHAKKSNYERDADNFSQIDFGPLKKYLDDDDITDISYSNNGQLWLKSLSRGMYRADQQDVDNELIEKIAFQCSNVMGKTFNMAHPFLDSESAELRMNFVHESIARNGIAVVFRKTPAKIRLEKQKLLNEKYIQLSIHDFLINCVKGHCNIIVCGETGSGKTELVKYLASHTRENEKLITIEDTLELHLDRIFPHRDIVAMKTNNIASYSDVLVTCMRQNPIWILLSEVRSAEAVTAVRNSISSGHYILSTIHADKAESIPHRMYSLLESNIDVEQFLKTIYRYVQIGVFVRGRYKAEEQRFVREIAGVCEFFVTDDTNEPKFNNIYLKTVGGEETYQEPTKYIKNYLEGQGVDTTNLFGEKLSSLAAANEANGIESDVKELDGEVVHISGKNGSTGNSNTNETVQKENVSDAPIEKPIESLDDNENSSDLSVPQSSENQGSQLEEVTTEPQNVQSIVTQEPLGVQNSEVPVQPVQPVPVMPEQVVQNVQPVPVMPEQVVQNVQPVAIQEPVEQVQQQVPMVQQVPAEQVVQNNPLPVVTQNVNNVVPNVIPNQVNNGQIIQPPVSNQQQIISNDVTNQQMVPNSIISNDMQSNNLQLAQPVPQVTSNQNVAPQPVVDNMTNQSAVTNNEMNPPQQSKFFAGLI